MKDKYDFDVIQINRCVIHDLYFITNCPGCMADDYREQGKQEGRKEVLEWILQHQDGMMVGQDMETCAGNENNYGNTSHLLLRLLDWQAKLKEWGL